MYSEKIKTYAAAAAQLSKRYNQFSAIRLITFLGGIALVIVSFSYHFGIGLAAALLFLLAFAKFIVWHQNLLSQKRYYEALKDINETELRIANGNFNGQKTGSEYADPQHPYAIDLDLFGAYSVFQYLNRTATKIGERTFARYLLEPATKTEILERQAAGADLKNRLEWRQDFQAIAHNTEESAEDVTRLLRWLDAAPQFLNRPSFKILKIALPLLFWATVVGLFLGLPYQLAVFIFILNLVIIGQKTKIVNDLHEQTGKAEALLRNYAALLEHLEKATFEAPTLQALQQKMKLGDRSAAASLRRLSYIIQQLNVRYNVFVVLLNGAFFWDWHWVLKLEKWKSEMHEKLPQWFEVLQTFDALITLGTLQYNHPEWVFPTIDDTQEGIEGVALGHCLIQKAKRVSNDLIVPNNGHIKLITGSNMAGKSTFLRTVGLNIVLAMAGCPVCAERLRLPTLTVHTSMRTQDVLHESTSSFYAELKRLKVIIEAVERGEKVFFLLDEILKGTNSLDRHTGSKALITQLIRSKGMGIIATHDLELGAMEAAANGTVENLCIEVAVENDKLIFDYKIKKGVSKSFNATYLMRNMGIKV